MSDDCRRYALVTFLSPEDDTHRFSLQIGVSPSVVRRTMLASTYSLADVSDSLNFRETHGTNSRQMLLYRQDRSGDISF